MSDVDRGAPGARPRSFEGLLAGAALWLVLAPGIGADPAPTIPIDQIPPDMPADVRRQVERLYDEDDDECAAAAEALGAMGPHAGTAAPFLASMLRGEVRHGRTPWAAAHALGKIGKAAVEPTILAFQFGNSYSRMRAIEVFRQLLDERAIPVLVAAAADRLAASGRDPLSTLNAFGEAARVEILSGMQDPSPVVRERATCAAPAFPTTNTVEALCRALADRDARVRAAALEAILKVRQRQKDIRIPFSGNMTVIMKDSDPSVRRLALRVLAEADCDGKAEALAGMANDPDGSVGAEAVQCLGLVRTGEAFASLLQIRKTDDPAVRGALIEALARAGGRKAAPHVRQFLGDPDPLIREKAATALGSLASADSLGDLTALLTDDAPIVRAKAAAAMGNLRDRLAVAPLKAALKDADKGVRMEAVKTLCGYYTGRVVVSGREYRDLPASADFPLRSPDVREGLVEALSDSEIFVRAPAAETLFSSADPPETEAALKALKDEDAEMRQGALAYLQKIRAVPPLDPVRALLKDPHPRVRGAAIALLARHGDRQSFGAFVSALQDHRDTAVCAIRALGRFGADAAAPLAGALGNPDREVRRIAAEALANLDSAAGREPLLRLLDDPDPQSRRAALEALNSVPREKRSPELLAVLLKWNISDPADRSQEDLIRRGPAAVDAAARLLKDQSTAVRLAAVRVLGRIDTRESAVRLASALDDGSALVREAAVAALAGLNNAAAIPRIRLALSDATPLVREAAAAAVGRLADAGAAGFLRESLSDQDWHVRWAAAESLGRLRDRQGVPQLRDALADRHWYVRRAAAESLGRIGDCTALPPLVDALDDAHWLVRSTAHAALCSLNGRDLGTDRSGWRMLIAPPAPPPDATSPGAARPHQGSVPANAAAAARPSP